MTARSVLLAGGGTAGHVSPLLALADCLRRGPTVTIAALGTAEGLESRLVPGRGYDLALVPKVPLPASLRQTCFDCPETWGLPFVQQRPRSGHRCRRGCGVRRLCLDSRLPCCSSPRHTDRRPRAERATGHRQPPRRPFRHSRGGHLPDTPLPRAVVTGMPLRREIALLDRPGLRPKALAHFGLDPQWPTVLVTGGSWVQRGSTPRSRRRCAPCGRPASRSST